MSKQNVHELHGMLFFFFLLPPFLSEELELLIKNIIVKYVILHKTTCIIILSNVTKYMSILSDEFLRKQGETKNNGMKTNFKTYL